MFITTTEIRERGCHDDHSLEVSFVLHEQKDVFDTCYTYQIEQDVGVTPTPEESVWIRWLLGSNVLVARAGFSLSHT